MATQVTLNSGAVSSAGTLKLQTNGTTDAIHIDTSQNVGIGTSSPTFDVGSGLSVVRSGGSATIQASRSDASTAGGVSLIGGSLTNSIYSVGAKPLNFFTDSTERMRIDSSGNVGIGTSSPSKKLEVGALGVFRLQTGSTTMDCTPTAGATDGFIWNTSAASYYDWAYAGTVKMRIDSSGNLLVGTTDASNSISGTSGIKFFPAYSTTTSTVSCVGSATTSASSSYILYSSGAGAYRFYVDYGGTIHATATSIAAISDATLKTNVKDLETGLTEVMALKPRRFDWINGDAANVAGFIAQEVEQVLPELVVDSLYSQDEEGNEIYKKNLKMGDILPTLVKAIQEQQTLIQDQLALINSLTARVESLENK